MAGVYLSLGSNLGDRRENIRLAIEKIGERVGEVVRQSSLYETEPWGFESDNRFVNAAVKVMTTLSPMEVLRTTQQIERELGRKKKSQSPNTQQRQQGEVRQREFQHPSTTTALSILTSCSMMTGS